MLIYPTWRPESISPIRHLQRQEREARKRLSEKQQGKIRSKERIVKLYLNGWYGHPCFANALEKDLMHEQRLETRMDGNARGRARVVCAMADSIHNEGFERQHISRNKQIEDLSTYAKVESESREVKLYIEKECDES